MNISRHLRAPAVACAALALSLAASTASAQQYRGFWAAVFQNGYRSESEINTMVNYAVEGRYNVIVVEVMAYMDDNGTNSHGAYWRSNILPWAPPVSASFDPLAYLCQQAHAAGIEVDAWLIPYRCSSALPPAVTFPAAIPANGKWFMGPTRGTVSKFQGSAYWLDACSPDVQEFVVSIVRELVANYEIDGIHWDYEIGGSGADDWFAADTTYANSGEERFKRIYGYYPFTGDTNWNNFRRRCVTELHARTMAEMMSFTSHPRQPLRHTSCLMPYDPVPSCGSYGATYTYFGDFNTWLQKGYIDAAMPMVYKCGLSSSFNNWVKYFKNCFTYPTLCPRHVYIGQGNYMNTPKSVSLNQMQYVYSQGLPGVCNYDYWYTLGNGNCEAGSNDTTWWKYIADNLYTAPATTPDMPWRNPATATEGTLWGRVMKYGAPVDDATITIGGVSGNVKTDGNGYYVFTRLSAGAAGTSYNVTATKGSDTSTQNGILITRAGLSRKDFSFGETPPNITEHPSPRSVCPGGSVTFTVEASGDPPLSYRWQKNQVNLNNGGHYSDVYTATLKISNADANDLANYRCVVTNPYGSTTSNAASLTFRAATSITAHPAPRAVCPGESASFTVAATGEGVLSYQWQKNAVNLSNGGHYSGVTSATLTVNDVDNNDLANYRCVVTGNCGSATSSAAALTYSSPTTISQHPVSQVVCPGATATFTVVASGLGTLSYQWQRNGVPISDGAKFAGTTTASLQVLNVSSGDVANYRCNVIGGCGSAMSNYATLTLNTVIAITQHPQSQYYLCPGWTTQFTVTATGGSLSYQWRRNGADLAEGGHYSGVNTGTLIVSNLDAADAGDYTCAVTGSCGTAISNAAALTVVPDTDGDGHSDCTDNCTDIPNPDQADGNGDGIGDVCEYHAILSWQSIRTHGSSEMGMPLESLPGKEPSTECRIGGIQKIRVMFDGWVSLGSAAAVTVSDGTNSYPAAVSVNGEFMDLSFSPALPDAACYTITLGPGTIREVIYGDNDCSVRALAGDTTGNGAVNLGDVLYVRSKLGQPVGNWPGLDADCSGTIDIGDVQAVKALTAAAAAAACP